MPWSASPQDLAVEIVRAGVDIQYRFEYSHIPAHTPNIECAAEHMEGDEGSSYYVYCFHLQGAAEVYDVLSPSHIIVPAGVDVHGRVEFFLLPARNAWCTVGRHAAGARRASGLSGG